MATEWKLTYDQYYVSLQINLASRGLVEDIFQNKYLKNVFHIPRKGMCLMIHPGIEYVNMWVMYEFDCDKVKLNITRNKVIGCNGSKALVTMDLYNSLKANIH